MNWVKLRGTVSYDPPRPDEFKKKNKLRTMVIDLDAKNLDLYFHKLIAAKHGPWVNLLRPMYGVHVTVVKGNEGVRDMTAWKSHEGERIEIDLAPETLHRTVGFTMAIKGKEERVPFGFWTVDVKGDNLRKFRKELGMKEDNNWHVTVAREHTDFRVGIVPRDRLAEVLDRVVKIIPFRGGNQTLEADLKAFRANLNLFGVGDLDGREFERVLHRNVPNPHAPWELEIINVLKEFA